MNEIIEVDLNCRCAADF